MTRAPKALRYPLPSSGGDNWKARAEAAEAENVRLASLCGSHANAREAAEAEADHQRKCAVEWFDKFRAAEAALSALPPPVPAEEGGARLCEDCPPVGYVTDKTRCLPCPRRSAASEDFVDQDAADAWSMSTEALEEAITQAPQDVAGLVEGKALDLAETVLRHFRGHVVDWTALHHVPQAHLDQAEAELRSVIVAEAETLLRASPISREDSPLVLAAADNNREALAPREKCSACGTWLQTGPWGFTDCPACNPDPARG